MELNGKGIHVVMTMYCLPGLLAHDLSMCRLTGGFRRFSSVASRLAENPVTP